MYENIDLICDSRKIELNYQLPKGFHFVDSQNCDPVKLAICTWKGFNHEDKGAFENWKNEVQGIAWNPARAYNGILSSKEWKSYQLEVYHKEIEIQEL